MSDIITSASIGKDHYRVELKARNHIVIGDEPESNGGTDLGMNPHEILASALGCCTCATLRMYADRKEMPLESVNVTLTLVRDTEHNVTNITRDVELVGILTPEDRDKLLGIANKCPVHKTLTNPINIETTLKS